MAALVAVGRLERLQSRALAKPEPRQHRGDRRERHRQQLGDLRRRHPQPAKSSDRSHPLLGRARGHPSRSRGTVLQAVHALSPVTSDPLRRRPLAHAGGRAASATDHPSLSTRSTISWRLCGQVLALPCSLIR